jgi:tetratricopeptide (TPR) repeat protein
MLQSLSEEIERDPAGAAAKLRELLKRDPLNADAYRLLARALSEAPAREASVGVTSDPLRRAAQALQQGDLETAEVILRPHLRERPDDDDALILLGLFASRLAYFREAEALLRLALEFNPDSLAAKFNVAAELYARNRAEEAIDILKEVLRAQPDNVDALNLNAAAHARSGLIEEAAAGYEESLRLQPEQPSVWSWYGQTLRSLGRTDAGIAAIKRGIEVAPYAGELWSSLSEFKTYRFSPAEVERMRRLAGSLPARSRDRMFLDFALGKGLEDVGDFANAFAAYREGNELQKLGRNYDPSSITDYVERCADVLGDEFAQQLGEREAASGPIFILGMPRSGSTLLEQMLGRHPKIEATMELPDFIEIAEGLTDLAGIPNWVRSASRSQIDELGQRYLASTRRYRSTDKPLFIDKMPNNWLYAPLILLALPGARIIDIRRHPLDCCMSNYKQLFLTRQEFSNDLDWLGRYYRDYVRMIALIDHAVPGRVQRVIYEQLVENSEREMRAVLDHIGVEFDARCLDSAGQGQIVRTASADQVRRPLNRAGIGSWKKYEPWLGPLVEALGAVLQTYPSPPR